ncbi:T9SS type A sorting domain-containing protein [Salibacteraceae bacterium]|nr:T9SS type A sorting domain-containing protein [Salibacteraceae bacterium]
MKSAIVVLVLSCFFGSNGIAQGYSWSCSLASGSSFCPMPAAVTAKIQGSLIIGNFPCPDSAVVLFEWGDGKLDTINFSFTGSYYYCYFQELKAHSYEIPGKYRVRATFLYPNYPFNTKLSPKFHIAPDCIEVDGIVYEDLDNSCDYISTDKPYRNASINFYDSSSDLIGQAFTDSLGAFSASLPGALNGCYYTIGSNGISANCPNQNTLNTFNDTTISVAGTCSGEWDLRSRHVRSRVASPGGTGYAGIEIYARSCDTGFTHTVLELPSQVEWAGLLEGPTPDSIIGNKLYWNSTFGKSPTDSTILFSRFSIKTKTTATIGSYIDFKVLSISDTSEHNLTNNNDLWKLQIGGPYDPNNKIVTPQGTGAAGNVPPSTEFTYTVNFQNTGNDTAKNVFVIDTLSEHLDIESIQILDSKHPMTVAYYRDRVLRFDFDNIQLPDSGASQEGSKGWFDFSIKAKDDLALGTEINNLVDIYFDYNAPIRTNATHNTIDQSITYPAVSIESQNNICINNEVGKVYATITGGTEPYTFQWNSNLNDLANDSVESRVHVITVLDANLYMDYGSTEVLDIRTIDANPGQISGNLEAEAQSYNSYEVVNTPTSSYVWNISGGTKTQDNGHRIKIQWSDTSSGIIDVIQTDSHGCVGSSSLPISIYPLSTEDLKSTNLSLYPNPTNGLVQVQLNELSGSDMIKILDMQGRVVLTQRISNSSTQLDLSELSSGTYTVRLSSDVEITEKSIIKR